MGTALGDMTGVDWRPAARIEARFEELIGERKWVQKFAGVCPPSSIVVDAGFTVPIAEQETAQGTGSRIWLVPETGLAIKLVKTSVRTLSDLMREKAVLEELDSLVGLTNRVHAIDAAMNADLWPACRVRLMASGIVMPSDLVQISDELVAEEAVQVLRALRELHARGIVHGDVHVGNIMLTDAGARLIDFGRSAPFVKLDGSGDHIEYFDVPVDSFWSVAYLSPFELEGSPKSRRDDVYRLSEYLFRLAGEMIPILEEPPNVSRAELAQLKRAIRVETRSLLNRFHAAMSGLAFTERPNYEYWIAQFEAVATAGGAGL